MAKAKPGAQAPKTAKGKPKKDAPPPAAAKKGRGSGLLAKKAAKTRPPRDPGRVKAAMARLEGVDPETVKVELTPKQQRFVDAYVLEPNATKAAIAAGYSQRTAGALGSRVLKDVAVADAIAARLKKLHKQFEIEQEEVLRASHAVAFTDVNELVQFRRHCCRYCWGEDMKYQLTPKEARQRDRIIELRAERPNEIIQMDAEWEDHGGVGYDERRDPNPACCECWGKGIGEAFIHDTRHLSAQAKHLYAGIEETKEGLKVRMKSGDKALDVLARHKQLYTEKVEVDFTSVPVEKLDELHEKAMALAAQRQAEIRGRASRMGLKMGDASPDG